MPHVVIVGAGISGLSLAFRLQQLQPGLEITVLEAASQTGGTIRTIRRDGFLIEGGPNGFLDSKPSTLQLCRDLGLESDLVPASESSAKHRFLFLGDKLRALPGGMGAFLKTDLLSWRGKLSFLMERFRPGKNGNDDESIDAFARRRAGTEVAETFADALVTGIHAGDSRLLSIQAAFPRIASLEREYGSVMKGLARTAKKRRAEAKARGEPYQRGGKLWSLRNGLGQLTEALSQRLSRPPFFNAAAKRLEKGDAGWIVRTETDSLRADGVILACPAYQQSGLLNDIDSQLADRVGGIAYNRVAVVALAYRRSDIAMPLDGFGYIAPQRLGRDLLGVQWCSSIFPGRAPESTVLMRAMCGGWHRAELVGWDDQKLLDAVRAEIGRAMGIKAPPFLHEIIRWNRAIPQYFVGHCRRIAEIEERLQGHKGLFLAGNAYHGVALNDCTERAGVVAGQVGDFLASRQH